MFMNPDRPHSAVMTTSKPLRTVFRLESIAAFLAGLLAYHHLGGSWGMFGALFLAPDLSLLGYLAGPRAGALAYNSVHSYLFAAGLALVGALAGAPLLFQLAAIAVAHAGLDRALGYGLKYATGFRDTHLGTVGNHGHGRPFADMSRDHADAVLLPRDHARGMR